MMSVVGWEPWVQPIVCPREEDAIHEAAVSEAVEEALNDLDGTVEEVESYSPEDWRRSQRP